MGYSSGEFDIGASLLRWGPWQRSPGAASVYTTTTSKQLWFIGGETGSSGDGYTKACEIGQTIFSKLDEVAIGAATAAAQSNWSTQQLTIDGFEGPATAARCGLVTADHPYLFWNQTDVIPEQMVFPTQSYGLFAAQYGAGQAPSQSWGSSVQLRGTDQSNSPIVPYYNVADVSATLFGTDTIFVACSSVTNTAPGCTSGDQNLYLGIFNTADYGTPTSGVWIPQYEYTWAIPDLRKFISGINAPGQNVTIDWFATGTQDATGPVFYLAIFFWPDIEPNPYTVCLYLRLALDENNVPLIDPRPEYGPCWDSFSGTPPITIARDPAGRLRGYACMSGQQVVDTYTFATAAPPDSTKSGTGNVLPMTPGQIPAPSADGIPPSVAYYLDLDAPQTVSVAAQGMDGQQHNYEARQYPIYEILFYSASDATLKCQISSYAYAQTIPSTYSLSASTMMNVITGIIDGPMPVANANLDWPWQDVSPEPDLGDITYGTNVTKTVQHQTSFQWTAGFKSEGESDKGWGPAWDISFNGGTGFVSGSQQQTSLSSICPQPSYVDIKSQTMVPHGHVWYTQVQFNAQLYRFLEATSVSIMGDPTGGPASDGSVSLYTCSANNRLLHFYQAPGATIWGYDDLSWEVDHDTPELITGNPAYLPDNGHIYACGMEGHLLDFFVASPWSYNDISNQANGQLIAGDPVPVVIGGQVHIFVRGNGDGHLLDFSPVFDQGYEDISGAAILGDPTFFVGHDGTNTTLSVFARLASNNHLMIYYKDPFPNPNAWAYDDLSIKPGGPDPGELHGMPISGDPVMAPTGEIYVCGQGSSGEDHHLLRYYYTRLPTQPPSSDWRMDDISSHVTWQLIAGDPAVYVSEGGNGATTQVFARRMDGHLIICEKPPDPQPWISNDLSSTAAGGTVIAGGPVVPPGGGHVYMRGTDSHLLDFAYVDSQWQVNDLSVAAYTVVIHDATTGDTDQAPKWALFQPIYIPQSTPFEYIPFSVTPGDLSSYTPEGWNATMQALGKQHPNLYQGDNYFEDVIVANAATLMNLSSGETLNYLPISWGGAPGGSPQFEATDSSFTEQSWTLESSAYVGVSGGEGATIFGMGEDESFKFLVGFTIQNEVTTTETEQHSWGVMLTPATNPTWGPYEYEYPSKHPSAMASYDFQIYFLPPPASGSKLPPNYWVQELKACITSGQEGMLDPSTIDEGAAAWRIVFVVTAYQSNDGTIVYPPKQPAGVGTSEQSTDSVAQPLITTRRRVPSHKIYHPIRTIEDLGQHLQWALSLELSTIPPYLCALYSITDTTSPAYQLIRGVAIEEMLHMMLATNLMNAIGARPSLGPEFVPAYPSFIPHHAAGGPFIQLQAFSPDLARTVFMAIEQPEPSPHVPAEGDYFKTIGQFYKAIEEGFEYCVARYGEPAVFGRDTGFQRSDTYFGSGAGQLLVIHDLVSAKRALAEITEQGEGATHPHPPMPGEELFGGYDYYGQRPDGTYGPILGTPWELSHYRKFQQLADGTVAAPATYPMQANPSSERFTEPTRALTELFDACYTLVLESVARAFSSPIVAANFFGIAFPVMRSVLPSLATLLMQTPLESAADPSLGPTAGPGFAYRPKPLPEIVRSAEQLLAHPPALGTSYQQLWQQNLGLACNVLREALTTAERAE